MQVPLRERNTVELHDTGWLVASILFALWLLPLGYLAEALPRMLFDAGDVLGA